MPSQKLVRCEIRHSGVTTPPTPRFVPLEIFGLWEYLMTHKHGFEVIDARTSLWLDMEDTPDAAYEAHEFERVTEVSAFVYSGRDEMFTRACRYFRTEDCDRLKVIFLSHYQSQQPKMKTHVRERAGIWVRREHAALEAV